MKAMFGTAAAVVIGTTAIVGWVYLGSDSEMPVRSILSEQGTIEEFSLEARSHSGDRSSGPHEQRSVAEILEHVVHPANQETTIATLLRETGIQIGAVITVDTQACRDAGIDLERVIRFQAPRQSARTRIDALVRHFDPDGKLGFSAVLDLQREISFAVTTAEAAEQRHLLPVPTDHSLSELNSSASKPAPSTHATQIQAVSTSFGPRNTIIRGPAVDFDQSFEGVMLHLADRLGMELWIELALLERAPVLRIAEVKIIPGVPAQPQLEEILKHLDSQMVAVIDEHEAGKKILIVTTRDQAREYMPGGSRFPLKEAQRTHTKGRRGAARIARPDADAMRMTKGLERSITGEPRDMPLSDALQAVAAQTGLTIRIEAGDLEAIGVKPDVVVLFDPRGREARAVLYELFRAADGPRESSVIYRFEKTKDGKFSLVVTTREAAERSGRTIPFDFNLSPDDI